MSVSITDAPTLPRAFPKRQHSRHLYARWRERFAAFDLDRAIYRAVEVPARLILDETRAVAGQYRGTINARFFWDEESNAVFVVADNRRSGPVVVTVHPRSLATTDDLIRQQRVGYLHARRTHGNAKSDLRRNRRPRVEVEAFRGWDGEGGDE